MHPLEIVAAVLLDFILGDPRMLPHPVRWIGWFASLVEFRTLRCIRNKVFAGVVTWAIVVGVVVFFSRGAVFIAGTIWMPLGVVVRILLLYYTIATRDLAKHGMRVRKDLLEGNIEAARKSVGMMVSRDTSESSEAEVVRAAVESVSENTSDATIAPLLFAAIGGPVSAMAYRAINTLDAMFGYRNERYRDFGKFSAKADDVANFLPSRVTGVLTCIAAFLTGLDGRNAVAVLLRDARKHESPNAGYPEAAAAGALGLRFGGPTVYFGKVIEKPEIGDARRELKPERIAESVRLMVVTVLLALLLCTAVYWGLAVFLSV